MSTKIVRVHGRQIIDSRGNPTVEADVIPKGECSAARRSLQAHPRASMKPSNLRDGDKARYPLGKGRAQGRRQRERSAGPRRHGA